MAGKKKSWGTIKLECSPRTVFLLFSTRPLSFRKNQHPDCSKPAFCLQFAFCPLGRLEHTCEWFPGLGGFTEHSLRADRFEQAASVASQFSGTSWRGNRVLSFSLLVVHIVYLTPPASALFSFPHTHCLFFLFSQLSKTPGQTRTPWRFSSILGIFPGHRLFTGSSQFFGEIEFANSSIQLAFARRQAKSFLLPSNRKGPVSSAFSRRALPNHRHFFQRQWPGVGPRCAKPRPLRWCRRL